MSHEMMPQMCMYLICLEDCHNTLLVLLVFYTNLTSVPHESVEWHISGSQPIRLGLPNL